MTKEVVDTIIEQNSVYAIEQFQITNLNKLGDYIEILEQSYSDVCIKNLKLIGQLSIVDQDTMIKMLTEHKDMCTWSKPFHGISESQCGYQLQLGQPFNFKYCPYCGKHINKEGNK